MEPSSSRSRAALIRAAPAFTARSRSGRPALSRSALSGTESGRSTVIADGTSGSRTETAMFTVTVPSLVRQAAGFGWQLIDTVASFASSP